MVRASRKHNSDGSLRYEGRVLIDGWWHDITCYPNEPDGEPRFVLGGRSRASDEPPKRRELPPRKPPKRLAKVMSADLSMYQRFIDPYK